MTEPFDLAIVGGGAAGLAAAVRAAASGVRVALLERGALGGRARDLVRVEAVLGHPVGLTGREFAERSAALARRFGADLRSAEVAALRAEGGVRILDIAGGGALEARAVILAVGAEPPALPLPGLREFTGSGVHFALPGEIPERLRSEDVVITGAPLAAAEGALRLSAHCRSVLLLASERRLPAELAQRLESTLNITVRSNGEIIEAAGVEQIETLLLRDRRSGRTTVRRAAALFVLGLDAPRTSWLAGALALDAGGFIATGPGAAEQAPNGPAWPLTRAPSPRETSVPGVFAAGSARAGAVPCTACSVEDGIGAAREAAEYLRGLSASGRNSTEPRLETSQSAE
jgi:thioredoxin reductase (NADPH)